MNRVKRMGLPLVFAAATTGAAACEAVDPGQSAPVVRESSASPSRDSSLVEVGERIVRFVCTDPRQHMGICEKGYAETMPVGVCALDGVTVVILSPDELAGQTATIGGESVGQIFPLPQGQTFASCL